MEQDTTKTKENLAWQKQVAEGWLKTLNTAVGNGDWPQAVTAAGQVRLAAQGAVDACVALASTSPSDPDKAIFDLLKDLIVDFVACNLALVTRDAELYDTLDMDELDIVELSLAIEEHFEGLNESDTDQVMEKWHTVGDIAQWLKNMGAKPKRGDPR